MAKRYDADYKELISQLNDAFSKKNSSVRLEMFDNLLSEKKKCIEDMPSEELRKIKSKIHSGVTDIAYLTEQEKVMLNDIAGCRSLNYRQVVWSMIGTIRMNQIMEDYTKFMENNEIFRTVYLYKGLEKPVRVVYENRENVFPIHDLTSVDYEKQNFLIKNVLAAEARREYHLETDSPFRMHGYLTSSNELLVIVSIYPYLQYSTGIREMMYRIFDGLRPKSDYVHTVDEKTIRQMNETLRQKSIQYWKNLLLPLGKSLTIPGELGNVKTQSHLREKEVENPSFIGSLAKNLRKILRISAKRTIFL